MGGIVCCDFMIFQKAWSKPKIDKDHVKTLMAETFDRRRKEFTRSDDGLGVTIVRRMMQEFPPLQDFEFVSLINSYSFALLCCLQPLSVWHSGLFLDGTRRYGVPAPFLPKICFFFVFNVLSKVKICAVQKSRRRKHLV